MMNRYKLHGAGLILAGLLAFQGAWAQEAGGPAFEADAISVRGNQPGKARLDLYTALPHTSLSFINTTNGFTARYEVTAELYELDERGRRQNLVQSHIWEQSVVVSAFAATQAAGLVNRTLQSLELPPGRYLLQCQVEDLSSNEHFVRQRPIAVRNFDKPVAVSDLVLLEDYEVGDDVVSITPSVSNAISTDQLSFKLFYELYAQRPQRVAVHREVARISKRNPVSTILGLRDDEAEGGEISYTEEELTPLKAGVNQAIVTIPMNDFKAGEYVIRVRVEDESGRELDVVEKSVVATWTGLAEHIRDVDEAIDQLQYIAKSKELRYIKEGKTPEERLARFQAFWEKRDPTPSTKRNERMEEYYYRVDFANRQYGNLSDGWKTDRGHVMVLFGEPDHVDRHPFNFNVKPYEVWTYYRIGRRFIFVDETGLGDYELLVPVWDERNRIR
jgi:GWxTD domain-containing protein